MPTLSSAVTSKDHIQGDAHAPATLVEYGDYQCPSCGDGFTIVQQLQKHFGDKLRFVFRNYPLEMHPHAEPAAQAAEFAADHDKFWEMHDLLYKHQTALSNHHLLAYAKQLDLPAGLEKVLADHTYQDRIDRDMKSGDASGLRGTPTFYLNGHATGEDYTFETLSEAIEKQLKKS